jgi:predicted ester cyclase
LDRFDAVRLFLERAGQTRPEVTMTPAVAQICRRLDGIPLALELAAARAGGVAIDRLVDELDDRFRLLTGGSRAGLARHRTLLASVERSYELLDPRERVLLRRLGVFAGGCAVEAAREVVGFAPLDPAEVLDLLGRLVDKSLAQLDDSGRYFLLETIRAYARARAAEAGETPTVAGHHLAWAADFAQRLEKDVERADPECLDLVERELPNIRAALDHAAGAPDHDHNGLRLMTALALFWTQRGYAAEGADYSLRVLAGDPTAPPALRARTRWAGAYDRSYTFDFDRAIAEANTALEEARDAGDQATQGRCLHVLAAATFMVDPGASRPLFISSLELARASGDRWAEADSLQFLGFSHLMQHRPAPAGELLAQSGAMADEMGNAFQQAWKHIAFGTAKAQIAAAFAADWPTLERLYADDVQYRDPDTRLSSRAAVLDRLRGQVDAFAGFDYTIMHTYGDSADGAVVEWSMSGDYAGQPVSLDIVTAYDFLADRIVSERNYWDNAALQAQLG